MTNQSTSTSSPTTHLTSSRTCQIRSADASPTSRMTKKSSTKLPPLADALKSCGYSESLHYSDEQPKKSKRNRQRNIIWFNPPFSKNVSTNVGQKFLKLIAKHFPENLRLHKIFNKNTVKVSYSCMPNLANIIKAHNNEVSKDTSTPTQKPCNCRKKKKKTYAH